MDDLGVPLIFGNTQMKISFLGWLIFFRDKLLVSGRVFGA